MNATGWVASKLEFNPFFNRPTGREESKGDSGVPDGFTVKNVLITDLDSNKLV
jgi:hypothetical protein